VRGGWLMLLGSLLVACTQDGAPDMPRASPGIGLRYLRAADDAGFAKADRPRPFAFPADHGSHPEYRAEWWYFTGNLESGDGWSYGFELTFFRVGLRGPALVVPRQSGWASNEVWMAHLALTDGVNRRFFARERMARGALDLAGARQDPVRVWVKGWSAARQDGGQAERWQLSATDSDLGLDLVLATDKPPIPNGDAGLDRKGPESGNASYYYSVPRMDVTGTLLVDSRRISVRGSAWMDREWSTSALGEDVAGWDWFGLRLSDGSSLMFYRLRRNDGSADAFSGGTLVDASGSRRRLGRDDVEVTPLRYWTSAASGTRYPVEWRLEVPSAGIALELRPYVEDQELNLSVRYWEGAMRGEGAGTGGSRVLVDGYLELAGY
jgi:predicted secreted hydrolase